LLENVSINGATGIIINISGPSDMTLFEVNEASKMIQQEAHEEANIIFGAVIDEKLKDKLRVTVIATGFNKQAKRPPVAPATTLPKYQNASPSFASPPAGRAGRQAAPQQGKVIRTRAAPEAPSPVPSWRETDRPVGASVYPPATHSGSMGGQMELTEVQPQAPLSELKKLVAEIGVVEMGQDEYDVPTFLRKQAD
jgi:cell division protein FtsZ